MGSLTNSLQSEKEAMPIAIVGLGCRLPGGASSPEKLWDLLERKQSALRETPPARFNIDAFYHPDGDRNGSLNNRGGHYLEEDITEFDAPFFSISPAEARAMDPMQRILLEVVYEALENAGIPSSKLVGSNTACYVGCFTSDYDQIAKRDPETLPKYHSIGTGQAILSNRISFCFDLKGPSVTLDTACSSSLVALHLACQSLRTGESSAAIVGGTHAILNPDIMVGMTNLHFLSADSKCYTFDARANGYSRGEGMAAVILKPLDAALRDNDNIRAVIRGTASNSNGKTSGITLPSKEAQIRLIRSAYEQADCDPAITAYCEAHGTGTPAGDPIEASAIGESLGMHHDSAENERLYIGSIKTNIGHLEGASGLAGLIKVVLSLEKGLIAPNLWFEQGNPNIDFDKWRLKVPTSLTPWPKPGLRRASLNGFGYGGSNAHVVLDDAFHFLKERGLHGRHSTIEEPTLIRAGESSSDSSDYEDSAAASSSQTSVESVRHTNSKSGEKRPRIFYFSSHEPALLTKSTKLHAEYLRSVSRDGEAFLDNLAFTLCERRSRFEYGAAVVATSKDRLIKSLEALSTVTKRLATPPKIGFVFTGQGAQWFAMGRELLQYPVFYQSIQDCDASLHSFGCSWSLLEEFLRDQGSSRINEAEISQPLCTALQIGLVNLYASWGIHPSRVVGHSSGEIAAAYTTGALDLKSAMQVAYYRGLLSSTIKDMGFRGGMMAAGVSEEEAREQIETITEDHGKVVVACVNSPRSVTLAGDDAALLEMQKLLTSRQVFARRLQVDTAYHSHHMMALSDRYRESLANLETTPWSQRNEIAMFSSVFARNVSENDDLGAEYWIDNMVSCVRFSDALATLCEGAKGDENAAVDVLLELGPHSALAGPVKQILSSHPHLTNISQAPQYMSAIVREREEPRGAAVTSLVTAATLFSLGYPVDLHAVNFPHPLSAPLFTLPNLPTYQWNHSRRYWAESRLSRDHRFRAFPRTDILGAPSNDWNSLEPRWRNFIRLSEQPWVKSHVVQGLIVYPAAGYVCMILEAAAQLAVSELRKGAPFNVSEYKVRDFNVFRALVLPETEDGIEVALSIHVKSSDPNLPLSQWSEFNIYSYTEEAGWAKNCTGMVEISYLENDKSSPALDEAKATMIDHTKIGGTLIPTPDLYAGLDLVGLHYGPEFQGIMEMRGSNGNVVGTVQVQDTDTGMPHGFAFPRMLHPATMDTFLQASIVALAHGDMSTLTRPFVPTKIQSIVVAGNIATPVGTKIRVSATSQPRGKREAISTVDAAVDKSDAWISLQGVQLISLSSKSHSSVGQNIPSHVATVVWEPDLDTLHREELDGILQSSIETVTSNDRLKSLEFLAFYFFDKVLNTIHESEVENMLPHHQKFYRYMRHQQTLVNACMHEQQTIDWQNLSDPKVIEKAESLIKVLDVETDPEGTMFVRMGLALVSVLRKEVEPLSLMMKDNLLHTYYTVSLGTTGTYPQVQKYISLLSHKYPDLDYLEIGAGTGGCTTPVLQALSGTHGRRYPRMKSYTYTDISSGFFEKAAEKFSTWSGLMNFQKLDVEQDPETQPGFEGKLFDVIIAANVLHATYDVDRTMKHVRKLLRPGGKLVLLDMTHSVLSVSLIFGNLPGWWNCSETWREYGPLLDEAQWTNVLIKNGFTHLQASTPDVLDPLTEQTRVLVASAVSRPETQSKWQSKVSRALIIVKDHDATVDPLIVETQSQLSRRLECVELCTLEESNTKSLDATIILSFCELDQSLLKEISPSNLANIQHLLQNSEGLLWVTRGNTARNVSNPDLALFQGLARSLRSEREGFPCITLDLATNNKSKHQHAADLIMRVWDQSLSPSTRNENRLVDREFSEENGILHVKRVVENTKLNELIAARTRGTAVSPVLTDLCKIDAPLQPVIQTSGDAEEIGFSVNELLGSIPLPENSVQIEVKACSLNLQDTHLIRASLEEDSPILGECAGVVTRVGNGVRGIAKGDRVVALCRGTLSTAVRASQQHVHKIPDSMSWATAATLPFAYVVAYYSFFEVARLRKGQVVLVSDADTSIGRAAVSIALCYGAVVYATVDTNDQKSHLTSAYDLPGDNIVVHRDAFSDDIAREVLNLGGINIILGNLSSDVLEKSWRLLSPFAWIIQLEKHNSDASNHLFQQELSKNIRYTKVDASSIFTDNLNLASELLSDVMELIHNASLQPTPAFESRSFSEIPQLLTKVQDAKFGAKVVFEIQSGDKLPVIPKALQRMSFKADASYVLVGGFGGLGRSIARWMAQNGARNLVFVSRSGASSAEAISLLKELHFLQVQTKVIQSDITDEVVFSKALTETLCGLPPLRGVIQGAMVLNDQVFSNMGHEAFMKCLRPKVQGSWSLHLATLGQPLDFFILLSSCASFWGNAGQANYAAGCSYQVALASHRRTLGLPATAIDVGKIANVGFVAENAGSTSEKNLIKLGLLDVSEDELLAMLEIAMQPAVGERSHDMPYGHLLTGVASSNDLSKGEELPFWSRDPVFSHMDFVRSHLHNSTTDADSGHVSTTKNTQPLSEQLAGSSSVSDRENFILDALLPKLARSLMMALEDMDAEKSIATYGVDSLIAVELRNWVSREASVEMPIFEILQATSLRALARKIAERLDV